MAFKENPVPKLGLVGMVVPNLYFLAISSQERIASGLIESTDLFWPEKIFVAVCLVLALSPWPLALYRARAAGSWRWFIACLFVWPVAYVYTLFINRGDSP
ncbi:MULTISPECIES: hypothetical protein [unclassified Microcoleus]|uniref:hypothetical protein n=1 Tax=unclassified Microcoleus TaxID=2642155 RepID=UPI002FD1C863